jgi:hypothetical protein
MDDSECDKLIIEYFRERLTQLDSYYDAKNSQISQILTINGVFLGILIVIMDQIAKGNNLSKALIFIGAILLFFSTIMSIIAYKSTKYSIGVPRNLEEAKMFLFNIDNHSLQERIRMLKEMIIKSLDINRQSLDKKDSQFNWALGLQYFGIGLLFMGYLMIVFPHQ